MASCSQQRCEGQQELLRTGATPQPGGTTHPEGRQAGSSEKDEISAEAGVPEPSGMAVHPMGPVREEDPA